MSVSQVVHTEITTNADTRGLKEYDSKLKAIDDSGTKLGDTLKNLAKIGIAGLSTRALFGMAEDFGEMSGLLASTSSRLGVDLKSLQGIVKEQAGTLNEGVFSYAKLFSSATLATQSFGGSLQDAQNLATAFTASLKLSGATASETTMVMDQAAKMFASGEANSRAFLSIAVKAPVLLDKLSKKFNMNAQQLKKALEDETISMNKLYSAIGETADDLSQQVQQGPMNFSHFMSQVRNELMYFVGGIEESTELLSNVFKTTIMILRTFLKVVTTITKAMGGWGMTLRLLFVAIVLLKKELIFMQAMKLGQWLVGIGRSLIMVGRGALFAGRSMAAAKIMATAGAALGTLAATFLITELIALAQGRPNFIEASIFYTKLYAKAFWDWLVESFNSMCDTIANKINYMVGKLTSLGGMVKGFFGFGRGKGKSKEEAPSLVSQDVAAGVAGGGKKEVTTNNNQKVNIEINGSQDPKEVAREVEKALVKTQIVQAPTYDELVQRAAQ